MHPKRRGNEPACPICERPLVVTEYKPFCSRRCADVDLGRWLNESYRVPAVETEEPDDEDAQGAEKET